ncbi:hypothetical protein LIT13_06615 [Flavobacterium psychrophilum]|uniref:hypothetical protein n=1 Tax=Flavobacterium psychrophilum TaxID=96345 RepID=UPI00106B02FF|nr:hypothetical protein [Flavobacterium psychrophilum]MCB5972678.1 hypothetical protein [Flavobacterium psychrophilum]MCB5979009.1 hypothetical protein [Flavobacterium psychrophilum]MCB5983268.1 hypothetical protein [Flavobacterium psychrophilum]
MKKIIILDFSTSEVHVFDFDEKKYKDGGEEFLIEHNEEFGFKESQCQWMISKEFILNEH